MPNRTRGLAWHERKPHERSHHRFGRNDPAFPARLVLTVSFVLSPAIGLFCHRPRCDASASSPGWPQRREARTTDFAVRAMRLVVCACSRPSQPAPDTRDDRVASLLKGRGPGRASASDLPVGTRGIFLRRSSCPAIAVRRTASLPLAYVPGIDVSHPKSVRRIRI